MVTEQRIMNNENKQIVAENAYSAKTSEVTNKLSFKEVITKALEANNFAYSQDTIIDIMGRLADIHKLRCQQAYKANIERFNEYTTLMDNYPKEPV